MVPRVFLVCLFVVLVLPAWASRVRAAEPAAPRSPNDDSSSARPGDTSATKDVVGFQQGQLTPPDAVMKSARSRAVHEVAEWTAQAAQAFDRGEVARAQGLVRRAVQRLEELEREEDRRGNGRARSSLATQRGRLHLEFLGDAEAAEGAFADAVVSDGENKQAQRALAELLARKPAGRRATFHVRRRSRPA